MNVRSESHWGITAVGAFLLFGALMAFLAATTLLWQGTALDRVWALNPLAYRQLAPFRNFAGALFLLLGAVLTSAGVGWLRRRVWAFWLAVVIIAVQVTGNIANLFRGEIVQGSVGFAIASALLFYLLRPKVKANFMSANATNRHSAR